MGDIGTGNPFAMGNPFASGSPFGNPFGGTPGFLNETKSVPTDLGGDDSFNIDELVKKIDAKIAEIVKEEELAKQEEISGRDESSINGSVKDISLNDLVNDKATFNTLASDDEEAEQTTDNKIDSMYDVSTNDDDFFDDFFSDD